MFLKLSMIFRRFIQWHIYLSKKLWISSRIIASSFPWDDHFFENYILFCIICSIANVYIFILSLNEIWNDKYDFLQLDHQFHWFRQCVSTMTWPQTPIPFMKLRKSITNNYSLSKSLSNITLNISMSRKYWQYYTSSCYNMNIEYIIMLD